MEQQKSFFELLDPKSALILGVVGGVLTLGTIGFVVLGVSALAKGGSFKVATAPAPVAAQPSAPSAPAPVVPKSDKPKVELFVMSYCPYGLQMEKAYVPAWELLKNKADMDVKFVSYIMHGKKEIDENTRQYCIQSEQPTKFQAYLKCFFGAGQNTGAEADYKKCLQSTGVNQTTLNTCVARTDKKFAITTKYNDQSTWLSGQYPLYPLQEDLNNSYGVQGSPTLIINGVEASVARTPEAVKQAICGAFNTPPAECQTALSNSSFGPGFGTEVSVGNAAIATAQAGCGTF
jgi:hypothetical protein